MQTARTYLSWSFAFTSLVCLQLAFSMTLRTVQEAPTFRPLLLLAPAMMIMFAVVFGMAWWTVFKRRRSARGWGIGASLINIQVSLLPLLFPPHSFFSGFLVISALGVVGLVAFGRKVQQLDLAMKTQQDRKIPGDGTHDLVNKSVQVVMFVLGLIGYQWWDGWARNRGIPTVEGSWYLIVMSVLILLTIVALHEFGHALTGIALGMKLRAFFVGPFQWRIIDGNWEFEFHPRLILIGGGKTGVVPSRTDFPRWAQLSMLSAGVAVNVATGLLALWVASVTHPDSPVQVGGLLALFGVWSVVYSATNLVPFRTGGNYSDGAQIYQLLCNGPWADLDRAFSVAGSSLVTPLRPKNYDIDAIVRAGRTIDQGAQGLVLRLLAYNYYLDWGKFPEAGDALREATLIYNQSASDIPAELLTAFIFGSAYICRDPSGARQWWTHMETKKPTRLNADYWLAASALHWIECDLKHAEEFWEKGNTLALRLPTAGAYDFDRHCYSLLRNAFNEVPAAR